MTKPDFMDRFLRSWIGKASLFILFAPFAIIFIFGFLFGHPQRLGQYFGIWFMASLTIAGLIATLDEASGLWIKDKKVGVCLLPFAVLTAWLGYVLMKEIGFVD